MNTGFSSCHPLTQLLFFASVLGFTMSGMHPVMLAVSLCGAFGYIIYSFGAKGIISVLRFTIPVSVMVFIFNPLFSHEGITVLTYLPDGNPLTMESVIFGAAAALLLSCTAAWFLPLNRIMTSDRIIFLLGRAAPRLSLLLSMILRFVSKLTERYREISAARKVFANNKKSKIRDSIAILSSLLQWSLESSVDTADSMNSRGYGLRKRSFYSEFRLCRRDAIIIIFIILTDALLILAAVCGRLDYGYYPYPDMPCSDLYSVAAYGTFLLLCLLPASVDIMEDIKWKHIQSEI